LSLPTLAGIQDIVNEYNQQDRFQETPRIFLASHQVISQFLRDAEPLLYAFEEKWQLLEGQMCAYVGLLSSF